MSTFTPANPLIPPCPARVRIPNPRLSCSTAQLFSCSNPPIPGTQTSFLNNSAFSIHALIIYHSSLIIFEGIQRFSLHHSKFLVRYSIFFFPFFTFPESLHAVGRDPDSFLHAPYSLLLTTFSLPFGKFYVILCPQRRVTSLSEILH